MTSAELCRRAVTGLTTAIFLSLSASYCPAQESPPSGCSTSQELPSAGGASIVQAATDTLQHKNWQPAGGEIEFTIKSFNSIPSDASVLTCFRWKTALTSGRFVEVRPSRLDLSSDGKVLKVTTTVPRIPPAEPGAAVESRIPLVPLAEVRILAIKKDKATAADVTALIGIPHKIVTIALALATVALALVGLYVAAAGRLTHPGILKANWMLRIISTPSGRASLSQFQIVVWTLVVAAAAVYVMASSGELIQITSGTLVLLGIAGAAGVAAKAHDEAQGAAAAAAAAKAEADKAAAEQTAREKGAAAQAATEKSAAARTVAAQATADQTAIANAADANASAAKAAAEHDSAVADAAAKTAAADAIRAKADAVKAPPPDQIPKWSDLVVNETIDNAGNVAREIDVARVQMLLFTLIAAVFVVTKVLVSYVIPEIPEGFQILMGISNGVYMGSKVVQKS